jgi:hypothetical protein
LKGGIQTGISYAQSFAEWEAAAAAGLDLWAWESGRYPASFRARVLAWHQAHKLVELHGQEAVNRAVERRLNRRRNKG